MAEVIIFRLVSNLIGAVLFVQGKKVATIVNNDAPIRLQPECGHPANVILPEGNKTISCDLTVIIVLAIIDFRVDMTADGLQSHQAGGHFLQGGLGMGAAGE